MSRHDPVVSIKQMLDYAQKAMSISRGRKRADLDEDITFNWGVVQDDLPKLIGQLKRLL